MTLELLISALNAKPELLISKMKIASDAILINQCDVCGYEEITGSFGKVTVYSGTDRGIGVSRNLALSKATADILLFSDDDIVYNPSYRNDIINEFAKHPEADGIFFNVDVDKSRKTYEIDNFGPVTFRNSGRFPAYSLAVKREKVQGVVSFSTLFGGGAKYSCGEDSLFIVDCLKADLKLYESPIWIGKEVVRPSTWFNGYNEKLFFDRGVLYHFLYNRAAFPLACRFILKHKKEICTTVKPSRALSLMREGIKEGRSIKHP